MLVWLSTCTYSLSAEHCFRLRNNAISDERVRDCALSTQSVFRPLVYGSRDAGTGGGGGSGSNLPPNLEAVGAPPPPPPSNFGEDCQYEKAIIFGNHVNLGPSPNIVDQIRVSWSIQDHGPMKDPKWPVCPPPKKKGRSVFFLLHQEMSLYSASWCLFSRVGG